MAENDFLEKIVDYKKSLLEAKKAFFASLKKKIQNDKFSRYRIFKEVISKPGRLNLIAEIKKASPSQGVIVKHFNLLQIAEIYLNSGVDAISVVTEDKYFLGKPTYIREVSQQIKLPVLTKDFIIDEVQIYEAFYLGASAILLITAILNDTQLKFLMQIAADLDLDSLVEVHNEKELERALKAQADIIGVNNRNLRDLKVDFNTSLKLIPKIPKDKVIVAESGIKTHEEIKALQKAGANAVLIGETFLKDANMSKKIQEVMYGKS